jgi:bacillithiol synthase
MADDLLRHSAHRKAEATTEALSSLGYKPQIFPREINLFYLETGRRERIVRHDRGYTLVISDAPVWTEQELLSELDRHPERFSPNVVLRPLYQEKILPNLAYVGGPAEVAYWLQLKPAFDHFGLPFPVLLPRNFALIVSGMLAAKLDRFGLQPTDLFGGFKAAKDKLLDAAGKEDVQLTGEMEELRRLFGSILQKAKSVDPSLAGFIGAEQARTEKILENIEKRLNKAEEQKQETGIRQLEGIANRLFPDGQLQERSDNFLNFYINDPAFIRAPARQFRSLRPPVQYPYRRCLKTNLGGCTWTGEWPCARMKWPTTTEPFTGEFSACWAGTISSTRTSFFPWCRNTKSIPGR